MKFGLACVLVIFWSFNSGAAVVSPTSREVKFSFQSEFQTKDASAAVGLVLTQGKFLFGYMQNPEIAAHFKLPPNITGIGAPRWPPQIEILSDVTAPDHLRTIKYEMHGSFLLYKTAAAGLLKARDWQITLPYALDDFFDAKCSDPGYPDKEDFWYFYDPFRAGCAKFRTEPLARVVTIRLDESAPVDEALPSGLDRLRSDNGNGEIFQIMAINGFDASQKKRSDGGRVNYEKMNTWFRKLGFKDTFLQKYKSRPIHQFDKTFARKNGPPLHVRITRLLAETELDEGNEKTFARFLKGAMRTADVIIYEGHSGLGANLDLKSIEKRAGGKIEFDRDKHQMFFFDSCSSYSYYLGMFAQKKAPGTLAVVTNGLESLFETEIPVTQTLYKILMNPDNGDATWSQILTAMEKPMNGQSFLLNVDVNFDEATVPLPGTPALW